MRNKIINMPPQSYRLILLSLPPLQIIYFFVLGEFVSARLNQSRLLVRVCIALLIVLALFALILHGVEFVLSKNSDALQGIVLLLWLSWLFVYLFTLILLSVLTVQFDRSRELHRFFDFTDLDYVNRFLALLFLPLYIREFHRKISFHSGEGNSQDTDLDKEIESFE